jgi:hypothetical protein
MRFRMPSPQTRKRSSGIPTPAQRNSNTSGNNYVPTPYTGFTFVRSEQLYSTLVIIITLALVFYLIGSSVMPYLRTILSLSLGAAYYFLVSRRALPVYS